MGGALAAGSRERLSDASRSTLRPRLDKLCAVHVRRAISEETDPRLDLVLADRSGFAARVSLFTRRRATLARLPAAPPRQRRTYMCVTYHEGWPRLVLLSPRELLGKANVPLK